MTPALLQQARARAVREELPIRFDEGFAETLPYPDSSFDLLVSMFGIMFSPFPAIVVSEMARVLRPGGRIALASWTPSGFTGKMSAISARHLPPPRGAISPLLWGDEATVRDRLQPGFGAVETGVVSVRWELRRGVAGAVEFFAKNSGPIQVMLGRLDAAQQAAFLHDLEQLWADNNLAPDGENYTLINNEYLQNLATRQ
jgi:SAM-dependent methyltransferase